MTRLRKCNILLRNNVRTISVKFIKLCNLLYGILPLAKLQYIQCMHISIFSIKIETAHTLLPPNNTSNQHVIE